MEYTTLPKNPTQSLKEYEVGYGKPPKEYRFKKGQSGNRIGRPKGRSDYMDDIRRALNQRVVVVENGKRKRMSKIVLVVAQLVNNAAKGDPRSIEAVIRLALLLRDQDDQDKGHFTLIVEGA
jgi:hypothetical protein